MSTFRKATNLYKQFPWPTATRLAVSEAVKRGLNPSAVHSYAQAGEDMIIEGLLNKLHSSATGYYVDVGCHDPFKLSNTMRLYRKGWKGLNIDANPRLIESFQRYRPQDISVNCIVSSSCNKMTFNIDRNPALSSLMPDSEQLPDGGSDIIERIDATSVTLDLLFKKHGVPRDFELLSIDVEGHDYDVLISFDLDEYRPKLIVIEMADVDILDLRQNAVVRYLGDHKYRLHAHAARNGYFLSRGGG